MSFWDPYDRYNRERRRRIAEKRRQAAEELSHAHSLSPELVERFQREIARARRERDEWADRYRQVMESLAIQQQALEQEREKFELEVESFREQMRAEAEVQRERLRRNAEQRAFEENRKSFTRLLEVIDNFDRALELVDEEDEENPFVEGIRLTHRAFMNLLERSDVQKVESISKPFDPSIHEAVAVQPSDEVEDGMILQEISPGYYYRGSLLRPSKVIIAQN